MASAKEALSIFVKRLKMGPDEQVLVLAGFLAGKFPRMDAEKFTDTMADLMQQGGLPTEVAVDFLAHLVDTYKGVTEMVEYLGVFAAAMEPPPPPLAAVSIPFATLPPTNPPMQQAVNTAPALVDFPPSEVATGLWVNIPLTAYYEIEAMFGRARGQALLDVPVGRTTHRFRQRVDLAGGAMVEVAADVMNTDCGPVWDVYLMQGNRCIASAAPGRELASKLRIDYGGVHYEVGMKPV